MLLRRILHRLVLRLRQSAADRKGLLLFGLAVVVAFAFLSTRIQPPAPARGVEMSPPAVAAPLGSVEAAIQGVILRGNQEQERAIATRDVSVMRDTATDTYYREMADGVREMVDSGITNVKLLKIEWGDIEVRGNQATATTWETWSTNLPDGSTDQSRDRNVYRLVQVGGEWRIEADDHPDIAAPFPGLPNPFR